MIKYIKGNILNSNAEILAHGCNCLGGFGAGIAKQFSFSYPKSKQMYLKKFNSSGWELGDVQLIFDNNKIIANCATQISYGREKKVYVDYNAIEIVFKKLYKYSKENNKSIAIPKIGAGLAGGNWEIIEKIINNIFTDKEILVYVFEN